MQTSTLQSFCLTNFKAVQNSGDVHFTPLTAFIGYNGSGKSSLVEGMETLQIIVERGLDEAMSNWRGFEYIWNQATRHDLQEPQVFSREPPTRYEPRHYHTNPMRFALAGRIKRGDFWARTEVNIGPGGKELFIQYEQVVINQQRPAWIRDSRGDVTYLDVRDVPPQDSRIGDGESILGRALEGFVSSWQFLSLVPQMMGMPLPQRRAGGPARLAKDGSNIAQYLLGILELDRTAFASIAETLQYVLPYARDLQPQLTSELERAVYLQMKESHFKVPGWLLSTGTLRVLALLAALRHPTPAPLIVIEEIENGLDPRAVHLIVEEIRQVVESGSSQVIITTHSPYLLDLLDLSQIILTERYNGGQPVFTRPADELSLQEWAKRFGPGKLYTMNRLGRGLPG
ncbi:MAG: ATP-binding protein [Chloroflexota bacterium]